MSRPVGRIRNLALLLGLLFLCLPPALATPAGASPVSPSPACDLYLYAHGNPVNGWDPSGHENLVSISVSTSLISTLAALVFSPDIANAPGPGDQTLSSDGDVDMVINIVGGHLIGKAIGFGVGMVVKGYSKVVGYFANQKGPVVSVRATAPPGAPTGTVAESFDNGLFTREVTKHKITVYRAEDGLNSKNFGRFFGTQKPTSAVDAEELSNILRWNNQATHVVTYEIPAGTPVYMGRVAGGAGQQIYIPNPAASGVKLMSQEPLVPTLVNPSQLLPGSLLE